MITLNSEEFKGIYQSLNSEKDVLRLRGKTPLDEGTLRIILGQKIVRETKRKFYIVQRRAGSLAREWKSGKSFVAIAEELSFSPVLTASMVLKHLGVSQRRIRDYIKSPGSIPDGRTRNEIMHAAKADMMYSRWGADEQDVRGREAEERIGAWLRSRGIEFQTQSQINHHSKKTPDFLMCQPIELGDWNTNWIESKTSFGDAEQMRSDHRRQLSHYVAHFGSGMVVYWNGFVSDVPLDRQIKVVSKEFFVS